MPRMSRPVDAGFGEYSADGLGGGFDPILRALLGPEGMLHANLFMRSGDGCDLLAGVIDEEGAGSAGARVNAKPVHVTETRLKQQPRVPGSSPHAPKRRSGGEILDLKPRRLPKEPNGTHGLERRIRNLKVEPTPPEARRERQLAIRLRPALKFGIKLFVQAPVQPSLRDHDLGGEEGLTPVRAERQVYHPQCSAEMVVDCHSDGLHSNAQRFHPAHAADLAKMK